MKKCFVIFLLLFSLGASVSAQETYTRAAYIEKYWRVAVEEMRKSGIPASITLAQACLESDNGNSYLAVKGNNHFGIKCHGWTGKSIRKHDDRPDECFRSYDNPIDSYRDHSDFLVSGRRYSKLFDLKLTDYVGWAYGLSEAGYATDPSYPQALIRIIEENGLAKYDLIGADESSPAGDARFGDEPAVYSLSGDSVYLDENGTVWYGFRLTGVLTDANGLGYIVASGDEIVRSIAREFGMTSRELKRYNDMDAKAGGQIAPGTKIYLEPKKRKASKGSCDVHTVVAGETLWAISQSYGIKLKRLCKMNGLSPESVLEPGAELKLR